MKMVIDIDKKAFDYIMACSFVENEAVVLNQSLEDRIKTLMFFDVLNAIKNGTPLPKGHGRLKDIDAFIAKVQADRQHAIYTRSWTADDVLDALNNSYAPTIIEANGGEE